MPQFKIEFTRLIERTYTFGINAEDFAAAKEFYRRELQNLNDKQFGNLIYTDEFSEIATDFNDAITEVDGTGNSVETKRLDEIDD